MNRSISSSERQKLGQKNRDAFCPRYRKNNNSRHLSERKRRRREREKKKRKIDAAYFERSTNEQRLSSGCQRSRNFTSWTRRGLLSRLLESRKRGKVMAGSLARIWISRYGSSSSPRLVKSSFSRVTRFLRHWTDPRLGFLQRFLISGPPVWTMRDRCSAWFESRRRWLVLGKDVVKARHGFRPWNDTTECRWKLESFETRRFSKEPSPNRVTNPSKIIYSNYNRARKLALHVA